MALTFPNQSRSYDEANKQIRFSGHDGMFEVPFRLDAEALTTGAAQATAEAGLLAAFDAARGAIYDGARRAYSKGRKKIYVLKSADFRPL